MILITWFSTLKFNPWADNYPNFKLLPFKVKTTLRKIHFLIIYDAVEIGVTVSHATTTVRHHEKIIIKYISIIVAFLSFISYLGPSTSFCHTHKYIKMFFKTEISARNSCNKNKIYALSWIVSSFNFISFSTFFLLSSTSSSSAVHAICSFLSCSSTGFYLMSQTRVKKKFCVEF